MKLQNEFTVGVPIERAWEVLTDIPAIAPCLPGASLTGQDGSVYSGKMKIKVGPATAEYSGTADFVVQDEAAHHVEISATGKDSRGSGNASALITADMSAVADGTKVTIETELKVAGKIAQFGKGVMGEISEKLIGQFVDCVEQQLLSEPAAAAESGEPGTGAATPTTEPPRAQEAEALDLMEVAGGAMAKRLAPIIGLVLVLILVKVLFGRRS